MSNAVTKVIRPEKLSNKISDAFPDEECLDIEGLAKEMGVKSQRARQLVEAALEKRVTQDLSKTKGRKILYPEPMVRAILEAYNSGQLTNRQRNNMKANAKRMLKSAAGVFEVPVFDPEVWNIIMHQFQNSPEKVVEYLQAQLKDLAIPVKSEIEKLDEEYRAKRAAILQVAVGNSASTSNGTHR